MKGECRVNQSDNDPFCPLLPSIVSLYYEYRKGSWFVSVCLRCIDRYPGGNIGDRNRIGFQKSGECRYIFGTN